MGDGIKYAMLFFIGGIFLIVYYGKQKPNPNDTGNYRMRQIIAGVVCIIFAIIILFKTL